MNLRIGLIILFINCLITSFSQDFWEQLYFPDTVTIRCITTNDLGHIFVGTGNSQETGGIYRSTDNAQSWELVYNSSNFSVLSIAINENGHIYAGQNGSCRLIVSENLGESWEDINLPPPSYGNVIKILCVGQDTIYLSTWESEGSFITYSFDSGDTWTYSYITDHPNEYVSDIDMSNTGELFVSLSGYFDDQGGVFKSGNYGFSWEYVGLLNHQVISLEINSTNDIFTGDWWIMNNDTPGIHALYDGSIGFELVFDAYHVTDIAINFENVIYATANEDVVRSFNNGQTWEIIEDELLPNIQLLHLTYDGYLFGTRGYHIVKSINPTITGTYENYDFEIDKPVSVYPNPFKGSTKIRYKLKNESNIQIYIYNSNGQLIKLIDKGISSRGDQSIDFDTSSLKNGVYFYSIKMDGQTIAIKKMIKN